MKDLGTSVELRLTALDTEEAATEDVTRTIIMDLNLELPSA